MFALSNPHSVSFLDFVRKLELVFPDELERDFVGVKS